MNTKVKEFLDRAKAKEREAFEKRRDEHLISLGLLDEESECVREYSSYYSSFFPNWDAEKKMYYYDRKQPIKVTDEEYEEILKYSTKDAVEETKIENGAEKFLGVMSVINLVIGIIAAVVLVFVALDTYLNGGYYFLASVVILLTSLISWAIVKVVLNISNNLHKINSKLK
jgi:hypothetical protein